MNHEIVLLSNNFLSPISGWKSQWIKNYQRLIVSTCCTATYPVKNPRQIVTFHPGTGNIHFKISKFVVRIGWCLIITWRMVVSPNIHIKYIKIWPVSRLSRMKFSLLISRKRLVLNALPWIGSVFVWCPLEVDSWGSFSCPKMRVEPKNRGKTTPKMDGLFHGKPY